MELAVSLAFALIVTLFFVIVLRPVALAIGLVDIPGGRKMHCGPTPVWRHVNGGSHPLSARYLMGASLLIVVGAIILKHVCKDIVNNCNIRK